MKKEVTKKTTGMSVRVEVESWIADKKIYADGWNVDTGGEVKRSGMIEIEKDGKKTVCRDVDYFYVLDPVWNKKTLERIPKAYARFGNNYITKEIYTVVKGVLDEAWEALDKEAQTSEKKEKVDNNARHETKLETKSNHPGWCDKCYSYCYGDCEAY